MLHTIRRPDQGIRPDAVGPPVELTCPEPVTLVPVVRGGTRPPPARGMEGQIMAKQNGDLPSHAGGWWYRLLRWMYVSGRPNRIARFLNRISALQFSTGRLAPGNWVTLEVSGRRTGRLVTLPVVVADHGGERYLVSMLGSDANWVRNVRAAGGRAVLRHGGRESVRLHPVQVAQRAPILRRYLHLAPGARPHVPVEPGAPLTEFERVAARFPVFRIVPDPTGR